MARVKVQGTYKGRVENNRDPKGIGRVQVRVPTLHGMSESDYPEQESHEYLKNDDLPWAYPMGSNGGGYDHGSFIIPDIGDYVWVMFGQDESTIIYSGGSFGTDTKNSKTYGHGVHTYTSSVGENETPVDTYGGNPDIKVIYKSPKGATIIIDETPNEESIKIIDRLGQCIVLNSPYESDIEGITQRGAKTHEPGCGGLDSDRASISIYDAHGHSIKMSKSGIRIKGDVLVKGNISADNLERGGEL